jgi:hypothetical protein
MPKKKEEEQSESDIIYDVARKYNRETACDNSGGPPNFYIYCSDIKEADSIKNELKEFEPVISWGLGYFPKGTSCAVCIYF